MCLKKNIHNCQMLTLYLTGVVIFFLTLLELVPDLEESILQKLIKNYRILNRLMHHVDLFTSVLV